MRVYDKVNKEMHTVYIYITFNNVVYKLVYTEDGKFITSETLRGYCPLCKRLVSCNSEKICFSRQMGWCGDFETE